MVKLGFWELVDGWVEWGFCMFWGFLEVVKVFIMILLMFVEEDLWEFCEVFDYVWLDGVFFVILLFLICFYV